jgi:hypothetical protein
MFQTAYRESFNAQKKAGLPRDRPNLRDGTDLELEAGGDTVTAWFQGEDVGVQT